MKMIRTPRPVLPILLVDDEEHVLLSFDTELRDSGYNNILACSDSREVMPLLDQHPVAAVLLDLWMPHLSGQDLLVKIAAEHPEIPIIVATGIDNVETVVACMKNGAFDYLVKPVESGLLAAVVARALRFRELQDEILSLREHLLEEGLEHPEAFEAIITRNENMLAVFRYVEAVAPSSQPVLVTGETGVGKELIARAVHSLSRCKGPLIPVNVAGLDDAMFSDALFGHRKGAFTGADYERSGLVEKAGCGTLFLDEIGDLNPASQVKLLRLVQEREYAPLGEDMPRRVEIRIIAATNRDLRRRMEEGAFRKDLYYRLRTHHVNVPPLRERLDDLPLLVHHFLDKAARDLDKTKPTPPPELFTLLECHSFPGNVRELEAMIHDAVSRHKSKVLSLDVFKERIRPRAGDLPEIGISADDNGNPFEPLQTLPTLNQAAARLIEEAIKRAGGNITQAAEMLGVTRQALSKRLKKAPESR
jgi:DNA-binding NtrC family response regulator